MIPISDIKFKEILKLEQKKYREVNKKYLVYSENIINEALSFNLLDMIITADEDVYKEYKSKVDVYYLDKIKFKKFKGVKNTPLSVGICKIKENDTIEHKRVLGINKIQDPGNIGTMIRSAKAFGIDTVVIDNETVDIYNPKVVQAMQGVQFSLNIKITNLYEFCKGVDIPIITTFLDEPSQKNIKEVVQDKFLLILGNESKGIEKKYKDIEHYNFKINIKYESLNVAIACGIALYELCKGE